jgi:hypothetical protein
MANTIDRFCSVGTELPTTAKVGRLFFLLDSVNGNKLYACKTANTWDEVISSTDGISVGAEIDPATGFYKTS